MKKRTASFTALMGQKHRRIGERETPTLPMRLFNHILFIIPCRLAVSNIFFWDILECYRIVGSSLLPAR